MKNDNLTTKESVYLLYAYLSIAAFLVMIISEITKNIENVEKVFEPNPIVTFVIVLNLLTFLSFYYYRKNIAQRR